MAGSILQVQGGLRAARVLVGMKGHRPSAKNIAIGKCMKAGNFKPNKGGRYDKDFQGEFIKCAINAGFKVGEGGRKKSK